MSNSKEKLKEYQKKYRKNNKESRKEYQKKYREENKEKLEKHQKKYREENKEKSKKYQKEYKKEYTEKNKEKLKEQRKKYIEKNKENICETAKKYRKNNEKRIKKYNKEYSKRAEVVRRENKRTQLKRDTDPIFRLNNSLSSGVRKSLKNNKISKSRRHWENLVGYTKNKLKEHLEKQFQSGMSWDNYGQWHIDHKIPLNFFKYKSTDDVEFKYCWSLNNLQPLWGKDNISKNDKIIINGKEIISRLYESGIQYG